MFDWESGRPTAYHPRPPAFFSIADQSKTVDEDEYKALQAELIRTGERFSRLGRSRHTSIPPTPAFLVDPAPIPEGVIETAITQVMGAVHPGVVRQEQILRSAFVARLPDTMRQALGTLTANVHPEMPTPSNTYQRLGKTKRHARIDLGFGHPTSCDGCFGVIELKTFAVLSGEWFQKQLEKLESRPTGLMYSGLAGDFQKLLDPKLPKDAFRYSWLVTKKRGNARPEEIAKWARSLLLPVERLFPLGALEESLDTSTKWLKWKWDDGSVIHLVWYWPKEGSSDQFEPVWTSATQSVGVSRQEV